jgi:hypothetical protein
MARYVYAACEHCGLPISVWTAPELAGKLQFEENCERCGFPNVRRLSVSDPAIRGMSSPPR